MVAVGTSQAEVAPTCRRAAMPPAAAMRRMVMSRALAFMADPALAASVLPPPGGGFDIYARAVAQHLGRYIPGNPGIVVKNMPGAGGARSK